MEQAQALFREGVLAFRNENDIPKAQRLLMQSLKLNPQNEMGWVWLSRTFPDQRRALDCVERALRINPTSEQALQRRSEILSSSSPAARTTTPPPTAPAPRAVSAAAAGAGAAASAAAAASAPKTTTGTLRAARSTGGIPTPDERTQKRITALLDKSKVYLDDEDYEHAIEQWVRVLEFQPDHEEAMRSAVRYLVKLDYVEDAAELLTRAIDAGTTRAAIYLTAIDIATRLGDTLRAETLRESLAEMPGADEKLVLAVVDHAERSGSAQRAIDLLERALPNNPKSQALLVRLAELYQRQGNDLKSQTLFERAARMGAGTAAGKSASKALQDASAVITDAERGSLGLAWREAGAVGAFFLLLAFQDAGLNVLRIGPMRWLGVLLAVIGGYLLITATSSPQQQPIASWFGGRKPSSVSLQRSDGLIEEPSELPILPAAVRGAFGAIGSAVLIGAFVLVFSATLNLLREPVPADAPTFCEMIDLIVESSGETVFYEITGC